MWNLDCIKIENLFSHKDTLYKFQQGVCTVILGKNETDRNLEHNGAGKTTLFEGICLALTGESLRNINKESFINREENECSVRLFMSNATLNKTLTIYRRWYRSGRSAVVELYENEVQNTQIVSVNEANKRIIELIGISKEDLLRYFIISQDNQYTFFTASDGDKKEVLNRITSADVINPILNILEERKKEKTAVYDDLQETVSKLEGRKEILLEQRQKLLEQADNADEEKRCKDKIAELTLKLREVDKDIKEAKVFLDKETKEYKAMELANTDLLEERKKKLKKKFDALEEQQNETRSTLRHLNSLLEGEIECPSCGHHFINDEENDMTLDEMRKAIKFCESSMEDLGSKIEENRQKRKKISERILKAEENNEAVYLKEKGLDRIKDNISNLEDNKSQYLTLIKRYESTLKELNENNKTKKLIEENKDAIKEVTAQIDETLKKIDVITDDLNMINFWRFNMGRSGFMTYLANKSVKVIEGITNTYLRKFGSDISVLINGFKVLKSGEIREKIDVFVMNDGVTAEQYMAKSGGERGRVKLAGILGIQHLINMSTNGLGLNFLALDETLSEIDARGQEKIIKILNQLGITVMFITQNVSDQFNSENVLKVVKVDGVSKFVDVQS